MAPEAILNQIAFTDVRKVFKEKLLTHPQPKVALIISFINTLFAVNSVILLFFSEILSNRCQSVQFK